MACSALRERRAARPLPRLHPQAQRQLAPLPAGEDLHDAVLPRLLPLRADRSRVRPGQGRPDRRRQSPQLPRPLRDRRLPALAAADELRRQGRAVRAPLAGMGALPARRLPDPPRRVRRGVDGDRAPDRRARRCRLHLPRGHQDPPRHPRQAQARSRAPRPADRRAGDPDRGAGHRKRPPRLAHPPAPGPGPGRAGDDLPARRGALAGAGRNRHGADLAQCAAAVGRPRRPAADAPRRGDRRRQLGDRGRGPAGPRRARGPARHPQCRARGGDDRGGGEHPLPAGGAAAGDDRRAPGLEDRARRPRPDLPGDPLEVVAAGGRGDRRPGRRALLGSAPDQGPDRAAGTAAGRIRRRTGARPRDRLPRRAGPCP